MGLMQHHAILATTWNEDRAAGMRAWLAGRAALWSEVRGALNGYATFLLAPDGSKEGWPESDIGDSERESLIARLNEDRYEDGSSPWSWIEVTWGEGGQAVVRGNDNGSTPEESPK